MSIYVVVYGAFAIIFRDGGIYDEIINDNSGI